MRNLKILFFSYLFVLITLSLYSFTQIDLNLTLSRIPAWQKFEKAFLYIGYFQRPLSTIIYLFLIFALYTLYSILLFLSQKKKLTIGQIWLLIGVAVLILLPSYPAFSHDIFNYIFDAKTIAVYHQNPYQVKPLDFPDDPMTRFMHWTHRPSVYPPLWIVFSIAPFILGFGKFVLQLLSFKAMMVGFYLGTIWLIWKISDKLNPKQKIPNVVFYAFSPLVLIESLVSAHNDGVMVFFALLAFYLLLRKRPFLSILSWLFSIGIKYVTAFLLPVFPLFFFQKIRIKKIDYQILIKMSVLAMYIAIFVASFRLGFQPWYLLWVLPFVALSPPSQLLFWLTASFSLGSLLRYIPFLYYGHWNPPVPTIKLWLTALPISLSFLVYFIKRYATK